MEQGRDKENEREPIEKIGQHEVIINWIKIAYLKQQFETKNAAVFTDRKQGKHVVIFRCKNEIKRNKI